MKSILQLKNIYKYFGDVKAVSNISLNLYEGEVLSLLGENGSGKTTLMNIVSGIYRQDKGEIYIKEKEVNIKSPHDAINLGIGMIHQHFKLVDVFTVTENIILGSRDKEKYDLTKIENKVQELIKKYDFNIDAKKKIYEMSVSEKQIVEILKVLYRGADILILDEPTAVLTPQENKKLFDVIKMLVKNGKSVILITHKLQEVLEISNRVVILRKGENVGELDTKVANEQILTEKMVGEAVTLKINRKIYNNKKLKLKIENLSITTKDKIKKISNINFDVFGGEILGIAGISGSGQKELLEGIAGLQKVDKGSKILFYDDDKQINLTGLSPIEIMRKGVMLSFVPEDRLGMGLVGSMNIISNIMLRSFILNHSIFLDKKKSIDIAKKIVKELEVKTPDIDKTPLRTLSGGNVQKILVGREIEFNPKVLMSAYAVRGLDINTSYIIYDLLNNEKMKGEAVIYVGEDLDVLLQLCDRIIVLCDGNITGVFDAINTTKEELGFCMTKN